MYKKYIITNITNVDPTINDNIAAGYTLGQEWFNELTGEKFLHKSDGVWLVAGIGITEVTYDELLALKTGSELVANQTYLLTDYETIWNDPFISLSFSSGVTEPLYITATDVDKLSNECRSKLYPQDIVYYEITGDIGNGEGTEGFTKGKIYRRIDTLKNNDIGTDWRHITYRRYALNVTNDYVVGNSYAKGDVVVNNGSIYICVFDDPNSQNLANWIIYIYDNGSVYSEKRSSLENGIGISLPGVSGSVNTMIPADPLDFEDLVMFPNYDDINNYEVYNNTIGTYKLHNSIIYYNCKNNIIGDDFVRNTIHNINDCNLSRGFGANNIKSMLYCNTQISTNAGFGGNNINYIDSNNIGGRFQNNLISGGTFKWNNIDEGFFNNIIKGSFIMNEVDRGFYSNIIFSSNFYVNEVGVEFHNNTIHREVNHCEFGNFNRYFNISAGNRLVNWNFGNDIIGSTIALPELGEEYTKKLVNTNGTYIIEYIDEYGDDIIADQLETFVFRSNQESFRIYGSNAALNPVLIEWGDGSVWKSDVTSFDETHTYTGKLNTDEYFVRIAGVNLTSLGFDINELTYFDVVNLPNTLVELNLSYNLLDTFNPSIALPSSLVTINLTNNLLTSFGPTLDLPSSLTTLYLDNNQLTTFDPSIALPSGLQTLILDSNQLTTFDPSIALPSGLQTLRLSTNQLTSFNPSIALSSSLTTLILQGNQLTSFDPSVALPSSLIVLNLVANQLTSFNPSIALPSSLIVLNLQENQLTSFNPIIALPSSLLYLELQNCNLASFNPSIALPNSITTIYLSNNLLDTFNPSIALPSSLEILELSSNQITSFDPTLALPSSLVTINLTNNLLTSFDPTIALPSSLQYLYLSSNQLTSFDPSFALPSSLKQLHITNSTLSSFNPTLALPASLTYLSLSSNLLTSFNPTLALPSSIFAILLSDNQLTSFNPTLPLPISLQYLYLSNNQLSTTEVNNTLVMLNARYTTPGSKYFYLQMSPSAPPSGAGITAKLSLMAKGYTVYTN